MRAAVLFPSILIVAGAACESRPPTAPSATTAEPAARTDVKPEPPQTDGLTAEIEHHGVLTDAGAAHVTVQLSCPSGFTTIEAFVILSQRDGQVSGQGGLGVVVCDGLSHSYTAAVQPIEGAFKRGPASASGYLLVCDAASTCPSLNFSRRVVLRKAR